MQALSQAQLRQIATVLQQKHLNSNSTETKNVLFDEQTKTRIVYRYTRCIASSINRILSVVLHYTISAYCLSNFAIG